MQVVATRCGWVRFTNRGVDGAVRFERAATGRFVARELVAAGEVGYPQVPVARLEAWANGVGRADVELGVDMRTAAPERVEAVDMAERSDPARRSEWGTGPTAEGGQEAALALTVGDRSDDGFYAEVARAYGEASVASARPAAAIADANGVDVRVVYEWLRAARRRGLIPSARKRAA